MRRSPDVLVLLGLRPVDRPIAGPALAYAFLGVGSMSLAGIAADTLFVSAFDLGAISRFYVVTAATRFAAAAGYAALARWVGGGAARAAPRAPGGGPRLDAALLVATAASTAAAGVLAGGASRSLLYAICVALLVLPPLLPLMIFKAVASSLETRQMKRLLPLVAAAATVGVIAASAAVPLLAEGLGTPGILYAGGLLAALAAPLPGVIAGRAAPGDEGDREAPPRAARSTSASAPGVLGALADAGRDLREAPVVGVVVAGALLVAVAANLVDYALKASLKARYERDEIAAFLGTFGAASNLVVLVAQLFGSSRFVARFGVRVSLQAVFAALGALGLWVGAAPGVISAAAAKLAEITFNYALSAPVADLLLTPAPPSARLRAKVLAKGLVTPLGGLVAGLILASFGAGGPPFWSLGAILLATGALGVAAVAPARRAYVAALARALGEGRIEPDVSPEAAAALRREVARSLAERVARGEVDRVEPLLTVMDDRFFSLDDLGPALRSEHAPIRRLAVSAALRVARPGEGTRLLERIPGGGDDETEQRVLARARELGAPATAARLEAAAARGRVGNDKAAAGLWAEALVGLAAISRDPAVDELRREALVPGSPRRAAALRAIGDLREHRAQKEVLLSLGSSDREVFGEAARAAVLLEARGAVAALLGRLAAGSEVRAVSRALALAGPEVIDDLIGALPTTRGQGAPVATSIASGLTITGTVRAARILARLGPQASARVLRRFADLGYRARNAVARALAAVSRRADEAVDLAAEGGVSRPTPRADVSPVLVLDAMELTLAYAESLTLVYPRAPEGLLRREVRRRIEETGARLLDLAAVVGDRDLITRARAALADPGGGARERGHALELLENVLPRPFAGRAVALLEIDWTAPPPTGPEEPPPLDGWLEKCRSFDADELASTHPMSGVLEKVLILVDASLFTALSGEELYPVAEIAESVDLAPGDTVVRQGDPGDALFVVARGSFHVLRDGARIRELGPGAVFGEMALLDGAPRAATVTAAAAGQVLRIPRAEFEALLDESPELARGVIRTLLGHLRASGP